MMTVIDLINRNARNNPDDIAFVEVRPVSNTRKEITWNAFGQHISRIANSFKSIGIKKGMRILLLGRNSISWLESFFGIMAAGAWVVPLNFRFTDADIRYCANIAEPVLFIFDEEYRNRIESMKPVLDTVKFYVSIGSGPDSIDTLIRNTTSEHKGIELKDDDECALYFTSGTTGAPKAVLHAHISLMVSAITEATNHEWTGNDINLMMPPLYHLTIGHLLGGLITCASNVLLIEKITPEIILRTISDEHITMVHLLVPWAFDLLHSLDKGEVCLSDFDLSRWRLMHTGAQPIPPGLLKQWKSHFPGMQYDITYGLSEGGGPGISHLGSENDHKAGSIGKPSLAWDMRIVDEHDRDILPGAVGEIIVKSSGLMKGYYKNPSATALAIRNGWLYTGDLGRKDEDGFIYIVDRKKDLIISGGENIYPVEIEDLIRRLPKVHDIAVIGVPHQRLGEVVCAVVEARPDEKIDRNDIMIFCEQNLPRHKQPHEIIFASVPRNPTGKLEKSKLREAYARGAIFP